MAERKTKHYYTKLSLIVAMVGGVNLLKLSNHHYAQFLRYPLIIVCVALLFLITLSKPLYRIKKQGFALLCLWTAFSLSFLASAFYNRDLYFTVGSVWMLFGMPIIYFWIIPQAIGVDGNKMLASIATISHLPFVIVSVVYDTNIKHYYSGIFDNPNQLGIFCSVSALGMFVFLNNAINKNNTRKIIIYSFALLGIFLILLATESRTNILLFIVFGILLLCYRFLRFITYNQLFRIMLAGFGAIFVLLVSLSNSKMLTIFKNLIGSMKMMISRGFSISGRSIVWPIIIQEKTLLGHGSGYFSDFIFSSHNIYLDVLGVSGTLSFVFFALFVLASVCFVFRYEKNETCDSKVFSMTPMLIVVAFFIIGMFENIFGFIGHGINILFFIVVGVIINSRAKW